jgi:hypothetical protein
MIVTFGVVERSKALALAPLLDTSTVLPYTGHRIGNL